MTPRGRLLRLRDHVVPAIDLAHFDMSQWLRHRGFHSFDYEHPDLLDCQTTACLVGWAASDKLLRAEGLGLEPTEGNPQQAYPVIRSNGSAKRADTDQALARFFGVSQRAADLLFYTSIPPGYDIKATLIARIERVIAGHGEFIDDLASLEVDEEGLAVEGQDLSRGGPLGVFHETFADANWPAA